MSVPFQSPTNGVRALTRTQSTDHKQKKSPTGIRPPFLIHQITSKGHITLVTLDF